MHVRKESTIAQHLEAILIAKGLDRLELKNAQYAGVGHEIEVELAPTDGMPLVHDGHTSPAAQVYHINGMLELYLEGGMIYSLGVTGAEPGPNGGDGIFDGFHHRGHPCMGERKKKGGGRGRQGAHRMSLRNIDGVLP